MAPKTCGFWSIKPFDPVSLLTKLPYFEFCEFPPKKNQLCTFLFGWAVFKVRYFKSQIWIAFLKNVWFSYWNVAIVNNLVFRDSQVVNEKIKIWLFKSCFKNIGGIFLKKFYLFIYFWLHWVFVAAHGLSLVAASGSYSPLRCAGFSLRWLLLLRSTGSRHMDFSSRSTRAR